VASKLSLFLAELKRRKVYRVAIVYVIVGVGILGAAEVILDPLGLEALRPYLVILILLGFPIALVLAWAYEVKPEEPREDDKPPAPAITTSEADQRKSIVVLPFDNMSPDPGDAYFSDGLTEEIITNLSHIHSLRVISRNSAMVLKGTQKDTRTIAEELSVQYVLEGSVRKAGDDLRITAQLIDAASDEHLWAEKYDGHLVDVFQIQEEVSQSIVEALRLELNPREDKRLKDRPIEDLQAYECYLRARYELNSMSNGFVERSIDLIDRGLERVGDNDLLYAAKGLALWEIVNLMMGPPDTYEGLLEEAQRWAERALTVNPDSAPAHALLGFVLINSGNPRGALPHFAEALRLDPGNPDALLYLGFMSAFGGWDLTGSRRLLERVATIDPLTPFSQGAVGFLQWMEGDFGAVIESLQDWAKQAEAGKSPWRTYHAYLHGLGGNFDEAIRLVDQMISDSPDHLLTSLGRFLKHAWLCEREQALEAVTKDLETGARWDDVWPLLMADGYALIDERDRALSWLEHAIQFGMTNVNYLGIHDPFLVSLRTDERFGDSMKRARTLSESFAGLVKIEELL
jgi:TolB-like protein